jgi:hypothetical protein
MPRLKKLKSPAEQIEALGWTIVHDAPASVLSKWETHDVANVKPASVTAEKYVDRPGATAQLVTEQAESLEQLLLQVEGYERHLASRDLA